MMNRARPLNQQNEKSLQHLYNQLADIRQGIIHHYSPLLDVEERRDGLIVTSALQYLLQNMDRAANTQNLWYLQANDGQVAEAVAMHGEAYLADSPEVRREQILDALPVLFIDSWREVTRNGPEHVKRFLSKLGGYCIDGRTREAFDYVRTLNRPPEFTEALQDSVAAVARAGKEPGCYSVFVSLANTFWEMPYRKDASNTSPCQENGKFDESKFSLILDFLEDILCLSKEEDPLALLQECDEKAVPAFLQFVSHAALKAKDTELLFAAWNELLQRVRDRKLIRNSLGCLGSLLRLSDSINDYVVENELPVGVQQDVYAFALERLSATLDRWLPPWWTEEEMESLFELLTDESMVRYLRLGHHKIKTSRNLETLFEKQPSFDRALRYCEAMQKAEVRSSSKMARVLLDRYDDLPLVERHLERRLALCRLNWKNPALTDRVDAFLFGLCHQELDIEVAVYAFKLYCKRHLVADLTEGEFRQRARRLLEAPQEATLVCLIQFERFKYVLPMLGFDPKKTVIMQELLLEEAARLLEAYAARDFLASEDRHSIARLLLTETLPWRILMANHPEVRVRERFGNFLHEFGLHLNRSCDREAQKVHEAAFQFGNMDSGIYLANAALDAGHHAMALEKYQLVFAFIPFDEQLQVMQKIKRFIRIEKCDSPGLQHFFLQFCMEHFRKPRVLILLDQLTGMLDLKDQASCSFLLRMIFSLEEKSRQTKDLSTQQAILDRLRNLFQKHCHHPAIAAQIRPVCREIFDRLVGEGEESRRYAAWYKAVSTALNDIMQERERTRRKGVHQADHVVDRLCGSLNKLVGDFFVDKVISEATFQERAKNAVRQASPVLRKQYRYRRLLVNLALAITTLGIAFLVNKAITGHFLFFNKPVMVRKVAHLSDCIESEGAPLPRSITNR